METKNPYWLLVILVVVCIWIGWSARGIKDNDSSMIYKSMAWGYDEVNNNWNRIQVDNKGYVICNKKE